VALPQSRVLEAVSAEETRLRNLANNTSALDLKSIPPRRFGSSAPARPILQITTCWRICRSCRIKKQGDAGHRTDQRPAPALLVRELVPSAKSSTISKRAGARSLNTTRHRHRDRRSAAVRGNSIPSKATSPDGWRSARRSPRLSSNSACGHLVTRRIEHPPGVFTQGASATEAPPHLRPHETHGRRTLRG